MNKLLLYILIVLIIAINLFNLDYKSVIDNLSYNNYISQLNDDYGNDQNKILSKINNEIADNKNQKEFIGVNLLVRQHYFYVWEQNDNLMKFAKETENYLKEYNMDDQLLYFYSMMSSRCIGSELYDDAYIYISRGEGIAQKIYNKDENQETLSTLTAIKYLKAVIAIDLRMENQADIVFNEAEELRAKGIKERIDINFNILLYYANKQEGELVKEYALKVIELIKEKDPNLEIHENAYYKAMIMLAENYINLGEIDKSIAITNKLSENEFHNNEINYRLYNLYGQTYNYYGNSEEYLKCLKAAYTQIEDTELNLRKLKMIIRIIEEIQLNGNKDELVYWYNIEQEIYLNLENFLDDQYLLSHLIDVDLENANYNIEILELQKKIMIYSIIILIMISVFVVIIVVIKNNRKKLLKEKIKMLEKNNMIQQKYYENIKINHEHVKIIKHDIRNHIIAIYKLISEKEYSKTEKYIQAIEKEINNSSLCINTNNKVIDAILANKMDICELENIDLRLDIRIPAEIPLEEFDICVIYGNLLDNAIEACKKISNVQINKYIYVKSIIKEDYLFINIKNSYDSHINLNYGKFITSKKDKNKHGIGIKNVKNSLKKYDGDMKINYNDNEFNVSILINIEELT